jgi:phage host-nuclease inhibitor protein Gam
MEIETEEEALPATVEELRAWMTTAPRVDIESQAGWWLRSLALVHEEMERVAERQQAETGRIRAHYTRVLTPLRDRAAALERSLEALAADLTFDGKRKSLALTYGTIGRRTVPTAVKVTDDAAAVAFARSLGVLDAIKVTEKPVHKVLAPLVLSCAEVPDGFEVTPAHDVAYVSTNSAAASGVA